MRNPNQVMGKLQQMMTPQMMAQLGGAGNIMNMMKEMSNNPQMEEMMKSMGGMGGMGGKKGKKRWDMIVWWFIKEEMIIRC